MWLTQRIQTVYFCNTVVPATKRRSSHEEYRLVSCWLKDVAMSCLHQAHCELAKHALLKQDTSATALQSLTCKKVCMMLLLKNVKQVQPRVSLSRKMTVHQTDQHQNVSQSFLLPLSQSIHFTYCFTHVQLRILTPTRCQVYNQDLSVILQVTQSYLYHKLHMCCCNIICRCAIVSVRRVTSSLLVFCLCVIIKHDPSHCVPQRQD